MKKLFSVLSIAFLAVGFTSCTGDYNCTCTTDILGQTSTSTSLMEGVSESDAQDTCDALDTAGSTTTTCVLTDA